MEHVVFFPTPDGSPAFRRLASLEEAVRFVEHLRNTDGVSEFSLYALTPVQLAMRAYYRVEPVVAQPAVAPPQPEPMVAFAAADAPLALPVIDVVPPQGVPTEAMPAEPAVLADSASDDEGPAAGVVPAVEDDLTGVYAAPAAEPVLPSLENGSAGRRGLGFFNR